MIGPLDQKQIYRNRVPTPNTFCNRLPNSKGDPADGADGGDVWIVCDSEFDNLLHLHKKKELTARDGSNANPAVGSAGPKKNK